VAARRAEGRRRLRVLVGILTVLTLVAAAWAVTASPLLAVDRVVVSGTARIAPDDVRLASGVKTGDAMVWLDRGDVRRRVEALPWVGAATVERAWPHILRIVVKERTAVAWVDAGGHAVLVDATGRVLGAAEPVPPELPELRGVTRVPVPGGWIDPASVAMVAAELGLLRDHTEAVVFDAGAVTLRVSGPAPEVRLGEPQDVAAKTLAAAAVLGELTRTNTRSAYVDVATPSSPVAGAP
jgi:cell division protein FtsQ